VTNSLSFNWFHHQLNSDRHFWHGLYRVIKSRAKYAKGKTYVTRFDVDGELNMFKALKKCEHIPGACHADDLFYLFNTVYHEPPPRESKDFKTIQRMVGIFSSFAVTGDPNHPETSDVAITAYDGSHPMTCINLTLDGMTKIPLPEESNMTVWNSVFEDHGVELY
jgi:cholinesterase